MNTFSRLMIITHLADDVNRALSTSIFDNHRVNELCGWLNQLEDGSWVSRLGAASDHHENFNDGIVVLDELLSVEFVKRNLEFNISDGYNLLVIADADYSGSDVISNTVSHLTEVRPGLEPLNVFSLELGANSLKDPNPAKVSFHVESRTEDGSTVNYQGEEWSALIVQLAEFLLFTGVLGQSRGERYALGYSSIGLNMTAGKQYVVSRTVNWLAQRELSDVDLDSILGIVNPVILKHSDVFKKLIKQQGHPESESLLPADLGPQNVSTVQAMQSYEQRIKESDLLADIDSKLTELVEEVESDIVVAMDALDTIAERQSLAYAISGRFPRLVTGKPLRDWQTIYDLYADPLMKLAELGIEFEGIDDLSAVRAALEHAKDINHNLGECESEIYRAKQLRRPLDQLEEKHKQLTDELNGLKNASNQLSEKCRENLRNVFSQVDRGLVASRVQEIIQESQVVPPPPPPPLEPVFAPWVISRMAFTIGPVLAWLIMDLFFLTQFLFFSIGIFAVVATAWIVIIAKRLNREQPAPPDIGFQIRNKYKEGCSRIAELYVTTRILQKFHKLMESGILFVLDKEIQDLGHVVGALQEQLKKSLQFQEKAFPDIQSEVSMSDRNSFDAYFDEAISVALPDHSFMLGNPERLKLLKKREWENSMHHFLTEANRWSGSYSNELTTFEMFHYLIGKKAEQRPSFLKKDLPSVSQLVRDAKLNMTILHGAKVHSRSRLFVFRYASEKEELLVEQFDAYLDKEFEHSATDDLFKMPADSANRISFLNLKQLDAA